MCSIGGATRKRVGRCCLRHFSWEKTLVISDVSVWFLRCRLWLESLTYNWCQTGTCVIAAHCNQVGGGGAPCQWKEKPVCETLPWSLWVSLHHLHLNTYILAAGWSSVVPIATANTHTIYTHTLTQEATALITDHSRKVCHYFKFRTFLKVHKLLKSAFGQNSVIRLKGIPSCACGFLRWMWDTVACVQLSQIASVILALLFFLPPAEDHPYRVPLLLSCVPSLWRLFEWGVTYLC